MCKKYTNNEKYKIKNRTIIMYKQQYKLCVYLISSSIVSILPTF